MTVLKRYGPLFAALAALVAALAALGVVLYIWYGSSGEAPGGSAPAGTGTVQSPAPEVENEGKPVSRREAVVRILNAVGISEGTLEERAAAGNIAYALEAGPLDEPITRQETAGMAARALCLLPMSGESPYTDCDDSYVIKLWEKGIWDSGTEFRPEDPVTGGEFALLLRGMAETDLSEHAFLYNDRWVDEMSDVPRCEYELTRFALSEDGVTYEDGDYTVLRGVDVSEFQKEIDWAAVKADGIDFAMLRIGGRLMQSGTIFEDQCFRQNVEGALAAGVKVGVYFFSQALNEAEGLEEAEFVLSLIEGYEIEMPVVIDWEYLGGSTARTYGAQPDDITAAVTAFCDLVAEAGHTPMAYMNTYCAYLKINLRKLDGVEIWFAQYSEAPSFPYHFTMWQYSDHGRVKGIQGNVDMNLYFVPS